VIGSEDFPEASREETRKQHKPGRFGRPEELAGAAPLLASDDASFVTGVALPIDGGCVAGHMGGMAKVMGSPSEWLWILGSWLRTRTPMMKEP
jgi:hypothetical protein